MRAAKQLVVATVLGSIAMQGACKNAYDERVAAHRGDVYDVRFADDSAFERTPDRILGRVCH